MYDIVFLTRLIPLDIKDIVLSKRKSTMSESGESLQWKIIKGIDENNGAVSKILNFLPVQSYPDSYPEAYVKRYDFSHVEGAQDVCLPFLNVKYIKRLFMGKSLYSEIKKWAKVDNGCKKVIISYSLIPEFSKALKIAKDINSTIVTCAIVADLPEYTVLTNNIDFTTRIYLKWMKRKTNSLLQYVDCFALLTEYMSERLISNQAYIVMEGISTKSIVNVNKNKEKKIIFYGGTLNEKFGILQLIEAFRNITNQDYKLVICGLGDSEKYIANAAKEDSRIVYLGQQKRERVLELMGESSVIVNPRSTDEEFTRYSFPSKNLEALSSGIPFVAYKLEGIPKEYDDYINYPDDKSVNSLTKILIEACEDVNQSFSQKAIKAKEWLESEKNENVQTKRILNMIDSLLQGKGL